MKSIWPAVFRDAWRAALLGGALYLLVFLLLQAQ